MSEGIGELPVGMQVGATLIATIIGGGIAFFSFTKKWLGKIGHKEDDKGSEKSQSNPRTELTTLLREIHDEQRRSTDEFRRLTYTVREFLDYLRDTDRD